MMTNRKAIEILREKISPCLIAGEWKESVDVAISVLQAQGLQPTCNQLATDTVSRKAAIDAINNIMPTKEGLYEPSEVLCKLMQLPYAQPEIIRCKDCKWWSNDDYRECSSPNYDDGYVTPAGFYCGYAERRTDERTD